MRYSQSFVKTTKETPKEAELISHQYLLRGGFVTPVSAGIYTLLPFGYRVVEKIAAIIKEELRAIGVDDIRMPIVQSARPWKESGRFYENIEPLWKIKNKSEEDFVLALTGEELVTDAAKRVIASYKDLPKLAGQIQTKVRDEARARGGLIRLREFMMQDAYSFDRNEEGLDVSYQKFIEAYKKIFERLGVEIVIIESLTGAMGGSGAHEFMMITESGEDKIIKTTAADGSVKYMNAEVVYGEDVSKDMTEEQVRAGSGDVKVDEVLRGIEVGNIFKLGTKYSVPQKLLYLDENNQQQPVVMGSYGIGVDRLVGAIVEASHDDKGMKWPVSVSPYLIHLVRLGEDLEIVEACDKVYEDLMAAGIEVFYDDREASAGEKFSDADLIGITWRITVSKKTLAEDSVEVKRRNWPDFKLDKIATLVSEVQTWGPDGEKVYRERNQG